MIDLLSPVKENDLILLNKSQVGRYNPHKDRPKILLRRTKNPNSLLSTFSDSTLAGRVKNEIRWTIKENLISLADVGGENYEERLVNRMKLTIERDLRAGASNRSNDIASMMNAVADRVQHITFNQDTLQAQCGCGHLFPRDGFDSMGVVLHLAGDRFRHVFRHDFEGELGGCMATPICQNCGITREFYLSETNESPRMATTAWNKHRSKCRFNVFIERLEDAVRRNPNQVLRKKDVGQSTWDGVKAATGMIKASGVKYNGFDRSNDLANRRRLFPLIEGSGCCGWQSRDP